MHGRDRYPPAASPRNSQLTISKPSRSSVPRIAHHGEAPNSTSDVSHSRNDDRHRNMSAETTISSGPDQTQIGRLSTGMERITATSSTLGIGRFSDGQALPLTASPDQFGSFADGQVARPTPSPSCASAASATDTTPRHRADQRPGTDSATRRTRTRNDPPRQPPRAGRTAHARLPNASTGPAHTDATARSQTIRQTGTAFRSECRQAHNVLRARPTPRRSQSARRPPAATCRSIRSHNVQALDPTSTREQCDAQMRQVRAGVARRNARHDSPRGADVRPSRLWPYQRASRDDWRS